MDQGGKAGKDRSGESLGAPTGTTVWCLPFCNDICACCSGCYNCCDKCSCCPQCCRCGPPCPGCFYCIPCVCCCCRPVPGGLSIDDGELVTEPTAVGEVLEEMEEEGVEQEAEREGDTEEGEAPPPSGATGVTGDAAAQRTKAATKKRAKAQIKKRAAKSQPKMFTGSAAGSPPPPPEACIGPPPEPAEPTTPLGMGIYLVYSTENGGSLYMKWSKTPLTGPGVLAYIKPTKEVGEFKFQKKDGVEPLCSGLEQSMQSSFVADRKAYYDGWATFVKQMDAWAGSLVVLPAATIQPPPTVKVVLLTQKKIRLLEADTPVEKKDMDLVAVVADNTTKFDVSTMEPSEFVAFANNFGASISFVPTKN
ncbi:hypothetical protein BESB_060620 [Besnoitia besnoiti]|uniref:Immune mapped protein 2 N-terminal domain-containing protein n=1 Tax=Besnoitia besnoiti TaxID=94643 RepID=A0A2A9MB20_BESBE|nr:hypothetical protein BESB_060620 [Besnoitia besnoiti]PFH35175.1 hypothetical protein BESB_060620 [Besnoitia besnoiti]